MTPTPLRFFVVDSSPFLHGKDLEFYRVYAHVIYLPSYLTAGRTLYSVHADGAGLSCLYPATKSIEAFQNAQQPDRLVIVIGGTFNASRQVSSNRIVVGYTPNYTTVVSTKDIKMEVVFNPHTIMRTTRSFVEVKDPAVHSRFEYEVENLQLLLTMEKLNA